MLHLPKLLARLFAPDLRGKCTNCDVRGYFVKTFSTSISSQSRMTRWDLCLGFSCDNIRERHNVFITPIFAHQFCGGFIRRVPFSRILVNCPRRTLLRIKKDRRREERERERGCFGRAKNDDKGLSLVAGKMRKELWPHGRKSYRVVIPYLCVPTRLLLRGDRLASQGRSMHARALP